MPDRYAGAMEETGSSLLSKVVAAVVLLFAAWLLLKFVIGFVAAIAWTIVGVLAVIAVIWAVVTLSR